MKYGIIIFIVWIALGLAGSGFTNSYFQNKYKNCGNRIEHGRNMIGFITGPINLIVSFFMSGYGEYGWSLRFDACNRSVK